MLIRLETIMILKSKLEYLWIFIFLLCQRFAIEFGDWKGGEQFVEGTIEVHRGKIPFEGLTKGLTEGLTEGLTAFVRVLEDILLILLLLLFGNTISWTFFETAFLCCCQSSRFLCSFVDSLLGV